MFSPQGQPDQEVGDLGVLQTVSATCIYYFFLLIKWLLYCQELWSQFHPETWD